jgi:hypothetical protein
MITTNISYKKHGLPNYHGQKGWKLMECIVSNATFATPLKGSPNACIVNGTISKASKHAKGQKNLLKKDLKVGVKYLD